MFRCVVVAQNDGTLKVNRIDDSGRMVDAEVYQSLDDVPIALQIKLKQLMWTPPNDHKLVSNLGLRIGDNIFWIHETGDSNGRQD